MALRVERWIAQDENGDHIDPQLDFATKLEATRYEISWRLRQWLLRQIAGGSVDLDLETLRRVTDTVAEFPRDVVLILRGDEPQ